VQLNAGSTLSYGIDSCTFVSQERKTFLRGEAYFDVSPDAQHPFVVSTSKETIIVLGTRFCVRDYSKLDGFQTTLLQGRIKVGYKNSSGYMQPGDEVMINASKPDECVIHRGDTTKALAWRHPYFFFTGMSLRQMMQQVCDWYGLDSCRFEKGVDPGSSFGGGEIDKSLSLDHLLSNLLTDDLSFGTEGRTIVIRQHN
jgi:transmembrane sensor